MSKAKRYAPKIQNRLRYTRGTLLYLFLIPLFLSVIVALFQTNVKAFILNGIGFFLFLTVITLAKKGFEQEALYNQSILARAPKIPYKSIAGFLLGASTFFTSFVAGAQPIGKSLFLSLIATVGYFLFYGSDPKKNKLENLGDISAKFVLETLHEAKTKLDAIRKDITRIHDPLLHQKLATALTKADNILQTIQKDPKDIRVARKFLIVYIDGIAKVTRAYTDMKEPEINQATKKRLHTLMEEVQNKFDKELHRLKNNNQFDLDVHIDTLYEQIKH